MNVNKEILDKYIQDPNDIINCLNLAEEYVKLDQPSAAFTYYMKCVERCPEDEYELRYHCLCMISWIYETLGDRWSGSIQYARIAKAIQPDRPEAYYQICKQLTSQLNYKNVFEQWDWIQVYENAKIGCLYAKANPRGVSKYYDGFDFLALYYCLGMLRVNMHDELKDFLSTHEFTQLDNPALFNTLLYIFSELGISNPYTNYHNIDIRSDLKSYLDEKGIVFNSSKNLQDIFAVLMNTEKVGTYLEIGMPSIKSSNSNLLAVLNWNGWSISNDLNQSNEFNLKRTVGRCLTSDLVGFDYKSLKSSFNGHINYLSISSPDCKVNNEVVTKFPWNEYNIDCITVTHGSNSEDIESTTKILVNNGFVPVVTNINYGYGEVLESWYVHRDHLSNSQIYEIVESIKGDNLQFRSIFK